MPLPPPGGHDRISRDVLLANVRRRLFGDDVPATTIGPYRVGRRIGGGAMGSVFEGFDPRLVRTVALKVVELPPSAQRNGAALLEEARALGRLDHPNVVSMLDAGRTERGLWIAMDLLEGRDLQAWLVRTPAATVADTLRVLDESAVGLVAVHAAGLVHRDIKPSNVFVGSDGRVVLIDFGLANPATRESTGSESSSVSGTPAYMAPEQHRGDPATPRSDQYAWCVMAWEALYGVRPFVDATVEGLSARKMANRLSELPLRAGVGARTHRALLRGLSPDPSARWDSMAELRSRCRARKRRWWPVVALGVGAGLLVLPRSAPPATVAASSCVEAIQWDDERASMRTAIVGAGGEERRAAWLELEGRLLEQLEAFEATRQQACDPELNADVDPVVRDRRVACLVRWRASFEALTRVLPGDGDRDVVGVIGWGASLGDPTACDGSAPAPASKWPPAPAGLERAVELVRASMVAAGKRADFGHKQEAHAELVASVEAARRTGFEPLLVEARFYETLLRERMDKAPPKTSAFADVYFAALEAGHPYIEVRAALALVQFHAGQGRFAEAERWRRRAAAADPGTWTELSIRRLTVEKRYASDAGAPDVLERASAELAALAEQDADPSMKLMVVRGATDDLLRGGHAERAYALAQRSLDEAIVGLGRHNPMLSRYHGVVAEAAWEAGRVDAAIDAYERSIVLARAYDSNPPHRVLYEVLRLSALFNELGRSDEAADVLGHVDQATASLETIPAGIGMVIEMQRAITARGQGELGVALGHFRRAQSIVTETYGDDHHWMGSALAGEGITLLDQGRATEAVVVLRRAATMTEEIRLARRAAEANLFYARALLAVDRAQEAVEVARHARTLIEDDHPATLRVAASIDAWLDAHGT